MGLATTLSEAFASSGVRRALLVSTAALALGACGSQTMGTGAYPTTGYGGAYNGGGYGGVPSPQNLAQLEIERIERQASAELASCNQSGMYGATNLGYVAVNVLGTLANGGRTNTYSTGSMVMNGVTAAANSAAAAERTRLCRTDAELRRARALQSLAQRFQQTQNQQYGVVGGNAGNGAPMCVGGGRPLPPQYGGMTRSC